MAPKITVNGIQYDSVEAMPPDVRAIYEKALADVPGLADRDGDGLPDIVKTARPPGQTGPVIQRKLIVNGVTYESLAQMPPELRQVYEQGMRAASAGGLVKKNEIKLSFQLDGSGFKFHAGAASVPATGPVPFAGSATFSRTSGGAPKPIEPPAGGAIRVALFVAAVMAAGLATWFLTRAH